MNKAIKPIQVVQTKHVGTCAHCVGYNKRLGPNLTPLHHVYKGVTWLHTSPKVYTYFCAYPKHDFASDWTLLPPSLHFGRRWLPSILCNKCPVFCQLVSSILSKCDQYYVKIVSSILSNKCPVFVQLSKHSHLVLLSSRLEKSLLGRELRYIRYIFVYTQITNNDHHTGPWRYVS